MKDALYKISNQTLVPYQEEVLFRTQELDRFPQLPFIDNSIWLKEETIHEFSETLTHFNPEKARIKPAQGSGKLMNRWAVEISAHHPRMLIK